eukprot:2584865-Prymnesium_polylepis.2
MLAGSTRIARVRPVRSVQSVRRFWSKDNPKPAEAAASPFETVTISEANRLVVNSIKSFGYSDAEAHVMKECMMWAQLRDNNQGIIKITSGGVAPGANTKPPVVEFDSPTGARVNGNQTMSMVVLESAVDLAIEKALAVNVAVVGTSNTAQSCGALGYYTEKIAKEGLIGIVMASSPECAAHVVSLSRPRCAAVEPPARRAPQPTATTGSRPPRASSPFASPSCSRSLASPPQVCRAVRR